MGDIEPTQEKKIVKWILPSQKRTEYKTALPDKKREWMDVNNGHAYKCLPLNVANGFGWEILNPVGFKAKWLGGLEPKDQIVFEFHPEDEQQEELLRRDGISSHFGNGIITFSNLNFIFRTTKGHNLFIKGPTNRFKHGAQALEAIVETDWLPYTFTLNWKLTKPGEVVCFEKNEPIACIFPIQRGYLESFEAIEEIGDEESDFNKQNISWAAKREELKKSSTEQNHHYYTKGIIDKERYHEHQKFIKASEFKII